MPLAENGTGSDPWLPIASAAAAAGVAERSAFRWLGAGVLPSRIVNGRRLVQVAALRAFANQGGVRHMATPLVRSDAAAVAAQQAQLTSVVHTVRAEVDLVIGWLERFDARQRRVEEVLGIVPER